jgi:hypothetical protein
MTPSVNSISAKRAPPDSRLFFFKEEICDGDIMAKNKFHYLIRTGRLKGRKLGNRTIVLAEDWENYLQSLPECPAPHADAA